MQGFNLDSILKEDHSGATRKEWVESLKAESHRLQQVLLNSRRLTGEQAKACQKQVEVLNISAHIIENYWQRQHR